MNLTLKLKFLFTVYDVIHGTYHWFKGLFSFMFLIMFDYKTKQSTDDESYKNSYWDRLQPINCHILWLIEIIAQPIQKYN